MSVGRSANLGLALCAFALMLDGLDNQSLGLVMPSLIADWHLSRSTFAPFIIVTVLLMSAGTAAGGWLGDRYGRKPVLTGALLLLGGLTLASAFAGGPNHLLVLRGLAALGMGGVMPTATALLAEYVSERNRSLSVAFGVAAIPLGGVFGGVLGSLILPSFGWRAMFAVAGAITVLASAAVAIFLPESPSLAPVRARLRPSRTAAEASVSNSSADVAPGGASILGATYRRDTLALWCALFFSMLGVYSMINWLPTLLAQQGHGLAVASLGLALFNVGGIISAGVIAAAMDRYGSRRPLIYTGVGAVIAAVIAITAIVPNSSPAMTILPLALMGFCVAGMQAALIAFSAQVYPTHIRSTGMGAMMAMGRLGALASSVMGTVVLGFGSAFFLVAVGVATLTAGLASIVARTRTRTAR